MRFSGSRNSLGNEALAKVELLATGVFEPIATELRIRTVASDSDYIGGQGAVAGRFEGETIDLDWRDFVSHVGGTLINLEMESEWIQSLGDESDNAYDLPDYVYSVISDSEFEESVKKAIEDEDIAEMVVENIVNDLCLAIRYRFVQRTTDGFLNQLFSAILAGYYPCGYEGQFPDGELLACKIS